MHLFLINRLFLKFTFLRTFNLKFSDIEVWFIDQNSKLLEKR